MAGIEGFISMSQADNDAAEGQNEVTIRAFTDEDWPGVWSVLRPVFRAGETYAVDPEISEPEAREYWTVQPRSCQVAVNKQGAVLATYYLKTNQPGPGSHVCNCGYIVGEAARGQGIASRLCEHSQTLAMELGYRAMQYNFVAASNTGALRLWQRQGFSIVGTLPKAFAHPRQGLIDAHVMYKQLV